MIRVTIAGEYIALVGDMSQTTRMDAQQATELASELQAAVLLLLRRDEQRARLAELYAAAQVMDRARPTRGHS